MRVPKIVLGSVLHRGDIWTHLYGVLGLTAFVITLVNAVQALNKDLENYESIILTLLWVVVGLIAVYVVTTWVMSSQMRRNEAAKSELIQVSKRLKNQEILNKYQSESLHTFNHYNRNILARLNQVSRRENPSEGEIQELNERFRHYLVMVTASLQNYFSIITQDNCSVSIKLLDDTKSNVYTYFRDPVNLKKRRSGDEHFARSNGIYPILDNSAFKMIMDDTVTNICFFDDNLRELADRSFYTNSNPNWRQQYNATIVVPISMPIDTQKRDIIGFVTIDNLIGKLATEMNKQFLFGVADMLYLPFVQYKPFM